VIAALVIAATLAPGTPASDGAWFDRWAHASRVPLAHARRLHDTAAHPPPTALLRALVARELATPGKYRLRTNRVAPAASPAWWLALWRWIARTWNAFWKRLFLGALRSGWGAWTGDAILIVAGLAMLIAAVWAITGVRFDRVRRRARAEGERSQAPDLFARACELARKNDRSGAVRLLFGATTALLDRRGVLRENRSATVREVRAELRARQPALVEAFDDVATAFVVSAYAERTIGEPEWERARHGYLTLAAGEPA
jgi:hypothetical protein